MIILLSQTSNSLSGYSWEMEPSHFSVHEGPSVCAERVQYPSPQPPFEQRPSPSCWKDSLVSPTLSQNQPACESHSKANGTHEAWGYKKSHQEFQQTGPGKQRRLSCYVSKNKKENCI